MLKAKGGLFGQLLSGQAVVTLDGIEQLKIKFV